MRTSTRSTRCPSAWRVDRVDDGLAQRELVHQRSFPAHAPAPARDRDPSGVDDEPGLVLDRLREELPRGLRELGDRATTGAHEMAVPVVGAVVDGRVAVELEGRDDAELGQEIERAVHGGAVGSGPGVVDRGEDLAAVKW